MSAIAMLALAGAMAAPIHKPIGPSDAERLAMMLDDQPAAAQVEILVDPQGQMASCQVVKTWGSQDDARKLCLFESSKGWTPAKTDDGKPAWGMIRDVLMFNAGRSVPREAVRLAETPEIELFVAALPAGRRQLDLSVALQVAPGGKPLGCSPQADAVAFAAYARLACSEAMKLTLAGPTAPSEPFVIRQRVRFSVAGTG